MKGKVVDTPWLHHLMTDCLTTAEFDNVHSYSLTLPNYTIEPVFGRCWKDGKDYAPSEVIKVLDTLGDRCAEYLDISNYSVYHGLMNMPPFRRFDAMHTDSKWKLGTMVLGLSDTGTGTDLYSNETDYHHTTPWHRNGGILFQRTDDTWHNYGSTGCTETRRTAIVWLRASK